MNNTSNTFQRIVFIICSKNQAKEKAVKDAIASINIWEKLVTEGYLVNSTTISADFESVECDSNVADQPIETATWVGAYNRITNAKKQTSIYLNDPTVMPIYIAIENGLFNMNCPDQTIHIDCPVIVITDGEGTTAMATGSGIPVNFKGLTYSSKASEHSNTDHDPNIQQYRQFVKIHIPDNSIATYFTHGIEDRISSMFIGVRTAVGNFIHIKNTINSTKAEGD